MPSTPYDLVKDDHDLRIPLHAEQAFFHGITFQAKLIGWQEVPRPNSRTEIVQAMRRIRYECKVQNTKKRKVTIQISVDGVKVALKKKKRKKKQWPNDTDSIELMQHPIYRIFYVSHDSSDLKIFSYIARDGSTDTFKCSVFKSNKKSQAMRIVRTVGQAFEVCHKFNLQKNSLDHNDEHSETPCDLSDRCSEHISDDDEPKKDPLPVTPEPPLKRPNHLDIMPVSNYNYRKSSAENEEKTSCGPNSVSKEMQQMREQLEQQTLQTRQALAQLMLVREQLITETNARIEAQARTQQLLQQNRELLEHLASLGGYNENDRPGLTTASIGLAPQTPIPMILSDPGDGGSPIRKAFATSANNNNIATINQQLNNLGSINQQLNTLSQQLSGLNQQSQNLQNFQSLGNFSQLLSMSPIQNINNNITNQEIIQQDLFQSNQELLNRLQNLSLGYSNNNSINNYSPQNSFIYSNPSQQLTSNNNINMNLLSSPSSIGNLTPSPILNRSSYSGSPLLDNSLGLSMERNLDRMGTETQFIRPLSQVSTLTTVDADGKVKVVVPVSVESKMDASQSPKKADKRVTLPEFVTLKVTDESGNITNSRKLSATPSFITRSTSEKVPNRSQMMSEVQRTAWARHTTK